MRRAAIILGVLVCALAAWRMWAATRPAVPRAAHGDARAGARVELGAALRRAAVATPEPLPALPTHAPLEVRVVDGLGRPVAGAAVDLVLAPTRTVLGSAVSGPDGTAHVPWPPGAGLLLPRRLGVVARTADGDEGEEEEPDPWGPTEVEVGPVALLHGVVVDEHGEPIDGARIDPEDQYGGRPGSWDRDELGTSYAGSVPPPTLAIAAVEEDVDALVHTAADGTFVVPLRHAGLYDVVALAEGRRGGATERVQLVPGSEAFVRLVLGPGGALGGVVRDEAGATVAGARIAVRGCAWVESTADDDGRFRIEGLPPGTCELEVAAEGFRPRVVGTVTVGDVGLAPVLSRGATLETHLCLTTGDVAVSVVAAGAQSVSGLLDPHGCATLSLSGLAAGTVPVLVDASHVLAYLGEVVLTDGHVTRVDATLPVQPVRIDRAPGDPRRSVWVEWEGRGGYLGEGMSADAVLDVGHGARWRVSDGTGRGMPMTVDATSPRLVAPPPPPPPPATPRQPRPVRELAPTCAPTSIDEAGGGLVVEESTAPAAERLFAGDVVLSIDGRPAVFDDEDDDDDYPTLDGPCGSTVHVRVRRPATGETLYVRLPRGDVE